MRRFDVGNFEENSVQKPAQETEKSKRFETVQLLDEITAVYKNENCENQNQDEKISMARGNAEDSTTKFRFKSETQAKKEKQEMRNKILKIGGILILCFLLLNFVLVVIVMNRTSEILSSSSTEEFSAALNQLHETVQIVDKMKFDLNGIEKKINSTEEKFECQQFQIVNEMKFEVNGIEKRINSTEEKFESQQFQIESLLNQTKFDEQLEAVEKENGELKNSHEELKEQLQSVSQKLDQLESNISRLTSPPAENENHRISAPQSKPITSCSAAMEILPSPRSKKQTIYPHGNGSSASLDVLCDFETDGGGWTLIQKRSRGPREEFKQNWNEYAKGFGSLDQNFWLGLDNIHALTKNGDQELRIELEDFEGERKWAKYSNFSVSDASEFYRLTVSGFSANSTAGDGMTNSAYRNGLMNGMKFSANDKDNDNASGTFCAQAYPGGWWFNECGAKANLNGRYREKGEAVSEFEGIHWWTWKGSKYSLAKTEMKIRKKK